MRHLSHIPSSVTGPRASTLVVLSITIAFARYTHSVFKPSEWGQARIIGALLYTRTRAPLRRATDCGPKYSSRAH